MTGWQQSVRVSKSPPGNKNGFAIIKANTDAVSAITGFVVLWILVAVLFLGFGSLAEQIQIDNDMVDNRAVVWVNVYTIKIYITREAYWHYVFPIDILTIRFKLK